ncbi:MAG: hypothetical protein ACLSG8_11355 [Barnesiella sp.]
MKKCEVVFVGQFRYEYAFLGNAVVCNLVISGETKSISAVAITGTSPNGHGYLLKDQYRIANQQYNLRRSGGIFSKDILFDLVEFFLTID